MDEVAGTQVNARRQHLNLRITDRTTTRKGDCFLGGKKTTRAGGCKSNDAYGEGGEGTSNYAEITFVAEWSDANAYQITFDEAGGSDVSDLSYNISSTTTLPSTTRNGNTFAGRKPDTKEGHWKTGRNDSPKTRARRQQGKETL